MERLTDIPLIAFLAVLTVTDYKYSLVPNTIVFPTILLGCYLTLNFLPAFIIFSFLALLNELNIFLKGKISRYKYAGGDIKLFTMIAAFKGWLVIPIIVITYLIIKVYREYENYRHGLPVTPFASLATGFTILTAAAG